MRKQRHKQSRGALPRVSTQSMSQPGGLTLEFADITSVFAYLLFFSPVCEFNLFIQINLYTESMELNKTFWGTHQPQENSSCAHGIHCIEIQIGQGSPLWWSLSRVSKSQRKPIEPNPSGYASENVRGLEIALGVNSQSHLQLGPTQGWRVFHTCTKPAMVWACCCVRLVLPPCHLTSILALAFIPGLGSLPLVHPCPLTRDVVVLEKKKKAYLVLQQWNLIPCKFLLFPVSSSKQFSKLALAKGCQSHSASIWSTSGSGGKPACGGDWSSPGFVANATWLCLNPQNCSLASWTCVQTQTK